MQRTNGPTRTLGAAALAFAMGCTPLVGASRPAGDGAAPADATDDRFDRPDVTVAPDRPARDEGCATPDTGLRSGSRDPAWPSGARRYPNNADMLARGALLDARGRIYIHGTARACLPGDPTDAFAVLRHRADGEVDTGFGDGGIACFAGPGTATSVDQFLGGMIDAAGRVYLVGQTGERGDTAAVVVRLTEDGALDPGFHGGRVLALRPTLPEGVTSSGEYTAFGVVEGDGGLYVAGGDWSSLAFLARVRADGAVDADFGASAAAVEDGVRGWTGVAREDGATFVAGHRVADGALVVRRLQAGGAFDPGFGVGGRAVALEGQYAHPRGLAVLPGGAVVAVAASQDPDINRARATAVRFTAAGELDTGFADAGVHLSAYNLNFFYDFGVLAARCDGRVMLTAHYFSAALGRYAYVEGLDADGRLDTALSATGAILGRHHDHAPVAVLVHPTAPWVYLVTRRNGAAEYAIERFAP